MLNMIRLLILSVSFIAACAHVSVAASFDCNNALNETEIVICDNPQLSALDNLIGVWWKTDRQPIGDTENPTVDSQREWVKRRNTCASDQICILAYYKSRIEEFGFGTVGIFDHAKGKPEFFLYSELFYAYQSSGFLYRFTNAERKAGQAKLENPTIIIPDLRYLEKINSCNKNSIKAEVLLVKATFKDVLGVNLSNNGQVMKEIGTHAKWAGHGDQSSSVRYRLINGDFIPHKILIDSCLDNISNQVEVIFEQ